MRTMRERPKTTTPRFAATVMLAVIMAAPANAQDGTQAKVQEAAAALVRGNPGQAVSSYTDALKDNALANDRKATILNDRAVAYVGLGQTKAAIEDFNKAVQLFPEYAATYNNRGNLLLALGLPKEALKDFDRAIVLAPGYVAAFNNRAGAHVKLGQQAEAIRDYTKAIELSPSNPAPLSGRGQALLSQGRPHAAIRDFSRAVNADARFASAYRSRGEAKLAIGRTEEAIEDLSRAIAFDSGNAEIYLLRGDAYLAGGNAAGAIKDFSRVIEIDQNSVAAYRARGLANSSAEAYDDALADLNRAIEIDPRSAVSFAYRAVVYKQANQADIGQKDLATAIKLDPNCAEVYWARAELAEAAGGQNDQAIADLRKALSLKPELRQASAGLVRLGAPGSTPRTKPCPGRRSRSGASSAVARLTSQSTTISRGCECRSKCPAKARRALSIGKPRRHLSGGSASCGSLEAGCKARPARRKSNSLPSSTPTRPRLSPLSHTALAIRSRRGHGTKARSSWRAPTASPTSSSCAMSARVRPRGRADIAGATTGLIGSRGGSVQWPRRRAGNPKRSSTFCSTTDGSANGFGLIHRPLPHVSGP